jgi:glucosamine--fructose-6-phosphate aminotransferase (isomerizing)
LALRDQLFLAVSQAGRSADIIETAAMAKTAGAITVAVVNDADSPLAGACDIVLPMQAGPELSVAASKSFIASLAMLLRLTAAWARDSAMQQGIDRLPERLDAARRPRLVGSARVLSLARRA